MALSLYRDGHKYPSTGCCKAGIKRGGEINYVWREIN